MKLRNGCVLVLVVFLAACGGAAEEPAVDTAPTAAAEPAPMDDAAALDELTEYFVAHYNMHHAGMVAELYAEDAVGLMANGQVNEGREAIEANMQSAMDSMSPTLSLEVDDRVIMGDYAVTRGQWALTGTPEGGAETTTGGNYLNLLAKQGDDWKTTAVLTNYTSDPPEGTVWAEGGGDPPAELADSPMAELLGFYGNHFNMGHGGVVASRFAEDGVAMFANVPAAEGRAAIEAMLTERIEAGGTPQLTIHEVGADDLGDGWVFGGGWYEMSGSTGQSIGGYLILARAGDDGQLQIHWAASNAQPGG